MLQNVEYFAKVQMMQAMKKMTQGFTYRSCILNVPKKEKKNNFINIQEKGEKKQNCYPVFSLFPHCFYLLLSKEELQYCLLLSLTSKYFFFACCRNTVKS